MKRHQSDNSSLINAWIRLEEVLGDTSDIQSPSKQIQLPQSTKVLAPLNTQQNNKTQNILQTRPKTPQMINSAQFSQIQSLKSLQTLRTQARPHSRPGTANPHIPQKHLENLMQIPQEQLDVILLQSEMVGPLNIDQVLDLYTAKCIDSSISKKKLSKQDFQHTNQESKGLYLDNNSLGLESANVIAHIIQSVDIGGRVVLERNLIGNSGIALIGEALKFNQNIVHLSIGSNDITQDGFSALFGAITENYSLISIDISNKEGLYRNKLGDRGAEALNAFLRYSNVIQFLNISNLGLSIENLRIILEGIQNCNSMCVLNIANNNFGTEAVPLIVSALKDTYIQELNIAGNKLGDSSANQFYNIFYGHQKHYRIKKYDLSNNEFTSYGISKIFEALSKNGIGEIFIFDDNKFNGNTFDGITSLLWENVTIRYLSFNNCRISPYGGECIGMGLSRNKNSGAKNIADGVKDHPKLQVLELEICQIDDQGGIQLAEMVRSNKQLHTLNLRENNLHDYTGAMLADCVRENKFLTRLALDRNPISYKFTEEVYKYMLSNQQLAKRNQIPQFMHKLEELAMYQSSELDIKQQQLELQDRAQQAQKDLISQKDRVEYLQNKELEATEVIKQQLDAVKELNRQIDQENDKITGEQSKTLMTINLEITQLNRDYGQYNGESIRIKQEIQKLKTQRQTDNTIQSENKNSKEKVFKEQLNKAKTSTIGYQSLVSQMEKLKNIIDKGSDSESENKPEIKEEEAPPQLHAKKVSKKGSKKQRKKGTKKPIQK